MSKYTYILFDWDGCLAKTLEVWLMAYKQSLDEYGSQPPDEEIAHHFGDWQLPKYFGIEDWETCNANAVDMARANLKQVELYPGAKKLLESLTKDYQLAILSSSSKDVLLNGLAHNGLTQIFDVVLSGEDVQNHKPHPEVIEKGIELLGGDKNHAVMIGDSRKDLGAAQNAHVDSILVYPQSHKTFYSLEELKTLNPTHVVSSVADVEAIIRSLE